MRRVRLGVVAAILVFMAVCLCACTDMNGEIPDRRDAERKAKESCPSETYALVNVVEEDTLPKRATYYFQSKERDLKFTVVCTLQRFGIDATVTDYYSRSVTCDYVQVLHQYYAALTKPIFDESGLMRDGRLVVSSYDDLETVAKVIAKVSEIYKDEYRFNDRDWIDANFRGTFSVCTERTPDGRRITIGSIDYFGADEAKVLKLLQMQYAQLASEGKINADSSIPADVMNSVRTRNLGTIYVNGILLVDDMANRAKGSEYNFGENVFTATYDYDYADYKVKIDVGVTGVECGPHPLEVYVEAAGGVIDVEYGKGKASWILDGSEYTLSSSMGPDNRVNSLKVKRDGRDLGISFGKSASETFLVYVSLSDLCTMLNMEARVDEEGSTLRLVR